MAAEPGKRELSLQERKCVQAYMMGCKYLRKRFMSYSIGDSSVLQPLNGAAIHHASQHTQYLEITVLFWKFLAGWTAI